MMNISDADLARMRADVAQLMPGTCIIKQPSPTYSGGARSGETLIPVTGGTVPCRFDPVPSRISQEMVIAGREGLIIEYLVTLPYNAPTDANYVITYSGNDYQIVSMANQHSWNVSQRYFVARAR